MYLKIERVAGFQPASFVEASLRNLKMQGILYSRATHLRIMTGSAGQ